MTRPFVELDPPGKSSRRLDMVRCAAALFLRDGIAAVRMTDVAEVADVGVATLYRRFKTKTGLVIAAGTFLWNRFNDHVRSFIAEPAFVSATGAAELDMLFAWYRDAYLSYPDFVRFVEDFDHLVLAEKVDPKLLVEYARAVDSSYPIFEEAYRQGLADGSIQREVDFGVLYRTAAHAMMGIAQRIAHGDVIPSDDFTHGAEELDCVAHMTRLALGIAE